MIVIDRRPVEANNVIVIDDAALDAAVAKLTALPGLMRDDVMALERVASKFCEERGEPAWIAVPLLLVAASSIYRNIMLRPNDDLMLVAILRAAFKAVRETMPEKPGKPE
ncbi:hypothetical protein HJB99_08040 [Rhizobium sp. NLR17b]|uniref:hypothetical protein n=1 Tax=unclassified Rhizobium TaxID=2613769 RepID=UPI001C8328E9|nr:hypothetical protein [Rhizobium sp. NLR17b]MBX5268625.1 hypothetical protein [Rhizobium sp. NLR17b]